MTWWFILAGATVLALFCLGIFIGRTLGSDDWSWLATLAFAIGLACAWPIGLVLFLVAAVVGVAYLVCMMPVLLVSALRGKAAT